jgi:ribosome-binding protein aMBF1 (putative translation factor)
MTKFNKWKDFKRELLSDPDVKKEYERLAPEYAIISQLITIRAKKGLTQSDLAKKLGTKQSAIARLESGKCNPTLEFLQKTAKALGQKLTVSFE